MHGVYSVEVPGGAGGTGWVRYEPRREGRHAIFSSTGYDLLVFAEAGSSTAVRTEPLDRSDACEVFAGADLATFASGTTYTLGISASEESPVLLFIEHLGSFSGALLRDCEQP